MTESLCSNVRTAAMWEQWTWGLRSELIWTPKSQIELAGCKGTLSIEHSRAGIFGLPNEMEIHFWEATDNCHMPDHEEKRVKHLVIAVLSRCGWA